MLSLKMTETEEMYLITVAQAVETGGEAPVPLTQLAEQLSILPASVNQMVHKLQARGLLTYAPYHGVELTADGWSRANRVLRRRRLWQVFLERHLGLLALQAEDLACRMEHITPPDVAERLSQYLGEPTATAHGLPIPPSKGSRTPLRTPLSALGAGQLAIVAALSGEVAADEFLREQGLQPGTQIRVTAVSDAGAMLIAVGKHLVTVEAGVANRISILAAAPTPVSLQEGGLHGV